MGYPMFESYVRRLRIWETNFGRDAGWIAERDGIPLAVLTEPRFEDMFWDSYHLEVIAEDPEIRTAMLSEEFWHGNGWVGLVYRNREFGEIVEIAFPAVDAFPEPGRLMIRALYLPIGQPWPWDWLVLWVRRLWQRKDSTHGST